MSVLLLEEYLPNRLQHLNVIILTKVRRGTDGTLYLRGAPESFPLKNAHRFSFCRDNPAGRNFTRDSTHKNGAITLQLQNLS